MTRLIAGGATDVGMVRTSNQDALLLSDPAALFAVADGMGGHAAGEVASATALAALEEAYLADATATPEALLRAAQAANRRVFERAQADPNLHGMGTTLVAVAMASAEAEAEEGPSLAVVNVGDSRLYRLRDGELEQVTVDHSLVGELVAQGRLAAEEAEFHPQRNVLTRALGVDPQVPVDLFHVEATVGDRLLLCSDGLIREVSHSAIAGILRRHRDPTEASHELISEARLSGGSDNITAVVIDVVADDDRATGWSRAESAAPAAVAAGDETASAADADATTSVPRVVAAEPPRAEAATQVIPVPAERAPEPVPIITSTPAPAPPQTVAPRPRQRLLTLRVVAFAVVLLAVLAAAAAGVGLYARGTYYVGADRAGQVVIYKGRPGGVLWFKPTVAARPGVTLAQVTPADQADVRAGKLEPSVAAAQAYVKRVAPPASGP